MAIGDGRLPPSGDGRTAPEGGAEGRRSPERLRDRAVRTVRAAVDRAGADGAVVNVSGGVDSATAAAVAADALGPEAVTAFVLPAPSNREANAADAESFAADLGIDCETVPLAPALEAFDRDLAPALADGDETARGNLAARLRMACAYFAADVDSRVVVGTANRTERLLGYFTKHGDGAADVFPLGDLEKGEVRDLATHLGVPDRIVDKPPTAGFYEGQTDEEELGADYGTLDAVLRLLVDEDRPVESMSAAVDRLGLDPVEVDRYAARVAASRHKRATPPHPPRPTRVDACGLADGPRPADPAAVADRLTAFVRDAVDRAGAGGVVVNVGGGLDAAVAATVATDALGPDRVRALALPCHKGTAIGTVDPELIADGLGVEFDRLNVRPLVTAVERALPDRAVRAAGTRELGALVARVRMACAYHEANTSGRLVLGTTNRTERLLGYRTRYGDGGVDLQPLGGLYRTEVRALGRHLGLPEPVLEQPAMAGFEVGRTDEDELGATYDTIDRVLCGLVDRDLGIARTAAATGVDEATVRRYARAHVERGGTRTRPPTGPGGPGDDERHFHELELKFA